MLVCSLLSRWSRRFRKRWASSYYGGTAMSSIAFAQADFFSLYRCGWETTSAEQRRQYCGKPGPGSVGMHCQIVDDILVEVVDSGTETVAAHLFGSMTKKLSSTSPNICRLIIPYFNTNTFGSTSTPSLKGRPDLVLCLQENGWPGCRAVRGGR